jgi:hypothetical protein
MVTKVYGPVLNSLRDIVQGDLEGIDGGVIYCIRGNKIWGQSRLHFPGLMRIHRGAGYTGLSAGLGEVSDIGLIVTGHSHKKSAGVFDAMRSDPPQDLGFFLALLG